MLLDYHAHVNFNAFKQDADEVIDRSLKNQVWMVLVGSQIDTSKRAVAMAEHYKHGVYASVGLHPVHLEQQEIDEQEIHFITRAEQFNAEEYLPIAVHPKTVAIGEVGIDYYHLSDTPKSQEEKYSIIALQKQTLRAQIKLADEVSLPLILHCRPTKGSKEDAYLDMLELLEEEIHRGGAKHRGVIHCFLGTLPIAQKFIEFGFRVGFTGIITFPNAQDVRDVAASLPLESMLIETDCPYLAPQAVRGTRNEPQNVRYVAEMIAQLKGTSFEEVAAVTFENSLKTFPNIPHP